MPMEHELPFRAASTVVAGLGQGTRQISADTTLTAADRGYFIFAANAGPWTITLPANAAISSGFSVGIWNGSGSSLTVVPPIGSVFNIGNANPLVIPQNEACIIGFQAGGSWAVTAATGVNCLPALTGDVTSLNGTAATTIANSAVTNAKLRNSTALTVIGRSANSTGAVADIAAGSDGDVLRRSGTTLGFGTLPASSIGSGTLAAAQMPALTGDVTTSAGSVATTLANTAVTPASYTSANITVDSKGRITAAANGGSATTGTFTPTIKGGTTAGTNTYSTQEGTYVKIGTVVFVSIYIVMTAKDGAMTGVAQIGGLPFTSASAVSFQAGVANLFNISGASASTGNTVMVAGNATVAGLYENNVTGNATAISVSELTNTSTFYTNFFYMT